MLPGCELGMVILLETVEKVILGEVFIHQNDNIFDSIQVIFLDFQFTSMSHTHINDTSFRVLPAREGSST